MAAWASARASRSTDTSTCAGESPVRRSRIFRRGDRHEHRLVLPEGERDGCPLERLSSGLVVEHDQDRTVVRGDPLRLVNERLEERRLLLAAVLGFLVGVRSATEID